MRKKFSKQILEQIDNELNKIDQKDDKKNQKLVRKIIEISKRENFPLGEKRKLFCKKCNNYFFAGRNCIIRIKNKNKTTRCLGCGYISRFKLKR